MHEESKRDAESKGIDLNELVMKIAKNQSRGPLSEEQIREIAEYEASIEDVELSTVVLPPEQGNSTDA